MWNNRKIKARLHFLWLQDLSLHRLLLLLAGLVGLMAVVIYPIRALYSQSSNGYMPAVKARIITETQFPICRWLHTSGTIDYRYYKWGSNLQTPGTLYRMAFESSIADWNAVSTKIRFAYSASGNIILNTYTADDGRNGHADPYCSILLITSGYNVWANTKFENTSPTANMRRFLTGHELGHSIGIGHIGVGNEPYPDKTISKDFISLMGYYNPDWNVYYSPQSVDIDFVNQFYP